MCRVSLTLRKGDEVKYLSHLDMMRAFQFALRRARIPVAYSEGFNPRPRMSFGSAVGVGITSDDERIVLELAAEISPYEVKERLNSRLPAGLQVLEAEAIPEGVKSPISALNASRFRIELECGECASVEAAVRSILDSSEVRVTRVRDTGSKDIDIRPKIIHAEIAERGEGMVALEVSLSLGDAGGARPQDFVQALGNQLENTSVVGIRRVRQFHVPT